MKSDTASVTYLDTETCGLAGPAVIIQYAYDDGDPVIHNFWTTKVKESVDLLDKIAQTNVVGFNLAFDWFQLCKMRTMFQVYMDREGPDAIPQDDIDLLGAIEYLARDGLCYKPLGAHDVMLSCRKGKFQKTMNRKDIRIRRVPKALSGKLAEHLEGAIQFDDILFMNRKKEGPLWTIIEGEDFDDVVLKFKPSTALKSLTKAVFGSKTVNYSEIEIDKKLYPVEKLYAPYAAACGKPGAWGGSWPNVIDFHIRHWEYNDPAREYALNDVRYTRDLFKFFGDFSFDDDDSLLACMVGAVRWRGFSIEIDKIRELRRAAKQRKAPTAPNRVREWLFQDLSEVERHFLKSTDKEALTELTKATNPCMFGPCDICNQTGVVSHPVAEKAAAVLDARSARKEIELYDKLIIARRLHASLKVIGTKSSRMSGTDKLNVQGIKHDSFVRSCFPLAFGELELWGGDFESFEVALADAVYNDKQLRLDLLSGKKIHALFGQALFPNKSYKDITDSKGQPLDMYDLGKRGVFALMYGGDERTLKSKLGVPIEDAINAANRFFQRYPQVALARKRVTDRFTALKQDRGLGTRITWTDPETSQPSLLGFRRYFDLEVQVMKVLFDLAQSPPKEWKSAKVRVQRRDRLQTGLGATQSALYGAAFSIQSSMMRAAQNHEIQSTGAQITKHVQRKIWDIQPHGYTNWLVQPLNIHDEIMCPTHPSVTTKVKEVVEEVVASYRKRIPLISLPWKKLGTWGDK
jgi:hypothetical protein